MIHRAGGEGSPFPKENCQRKWHFCVFFAICAGGKAGQLRQRKNQSRKARDNFSSPP
jgi:hypothetical protein